MGRELNSIQMLELAAEVLAPMKDELAFVGGAVAWLYVDSDAAVPLRPTDDVDCVIEVGSQSDYAKLEERLRELGLKHGTTSQLICRWEARGIKIDVMPTDPKILGFSNEWYLKGLKQKEARILPSGRTIYILPLSYFLACKFEALNNRGGDDWRLAHDLEDILLVLDGCKDPAAQIHLSNPSVNNFLADAASRLIEHQDVDEILISHLAQEGGERISRVKGILAVISKI